MHGGVADFDLLILYHRNWKKRFYEHLRGKHDLDPATVRRDDLCNMGRWIYGEGLQHQDRLEYLDLKRKHARFHEMAAEVLESSLKLPEQEALKLVEQDSEFERASRECVAAIARMRDALEEQAPSS